MPLSKILKRQLTNAEKTCIFGVQHLLQWYLTPTVFLLVLEILRVKIRKSRSYQKGTVPRHWFNKMKKMRALGALIFPLFLCVLCTTWFVTTESDGGKPLPLPKLYREQHQAIHIVKKHQFILKVSTYFHLKKLLWNWKNKCTIVNDFEGHLTGSNRFVCLSRIDLNTGLDNNYFWTRSKIYTQPSHFDWALLAPEQLDRTQILKWCWKILFQSFTFFGYCYAIFTHLHQTKRMEMQYATMGECIKSFMTSGKKT